MLSPPLIRQFWETVNDLYDRPSIHNELTDLILQRIKYQLKFRDSLSPDKIKPQSLLQRLDTYGLGKKRPLEEFLRISEIHMDTQRVGPANWCRQGSPPPTK